MMQEAIERHIPGFSLWDQEILPLPIDQKKWEEPEADILVVLGLNLRLYEDHCSYLHQNEKRRLIFLEERKGAIIALSLQKEEEKVLSFLRDPQVQIHFLETPFQKVPLAKKIAWDSVLLSLQVISSYHSETLEQLGLLLKQVHDHAALLLADTVHFGALEVLHARKNSVVPSRSFLGLANAFCNVPAILVGAGPSLENNRSFLKDFKGSALLFSGGTAISKMEVEPHFAVAIDRNTPISHIPFPKAPICFASRVHPDTLALMQGDRLQIPDGHFSFLSHLAGSDTCFDVGWTVGTAMASLALHLGCNPIIAVGMDYCYQKGKKYAFEEKELFLKQTEPDWQMAVEWMKELQQKHPETDFFNASQGGMSYWEPISLSSCSFPMQGDLYQEVAKKIKTLNWIDGSRWKPWEESLTRTYARLLAQESIEEEWVFQKLLKPLWDLWFPLFKDPDYEPLFFQTVLEKHKEAIECPL